MKKIITLTHEQAVRLTSYLLLSTNFRKGELQTWEELATEKKPDGTLRFPNAPGNAKFWADLELELGEIRRIIENAPLVEEV